MYRVDAAPHVNQEGSQPQSQHAWSNAGAELQSVRPRVVLNVINTVTWIKYIGVIAGTASQKVVAGPAVQHIIGIAAGERVVSCVANEAVLYAIHPFQRIIVGSTDDGISIGRHRSQRSGIPHRAILKM